MSHQERLLLQAASYGLNDMVTKLIKRRGVDVNYQCEESGFTALCVAAFAGHKEVVKTLLRNGADVDICSWDLDENNSEGTCTPLFYAKNSFCGSQEIVNMLLEAGAEYGGENNDEDEGGEAAAE